MKLTYFFILSILLFLHQQACQTRQQATNEPTHSDTTTAPTAPGPPDAHAPEPLTGRLAALELTHDSHWRGINLGDDFTKIKVTEKGEPFEQDAKHVGYTIEFDNLETADMLYYGQNGKVSAIEVDLFLNNRASVNAYQNALSSYFSTRYGDPKSGAVGTVWNGPTGEQVTLKDVSKGKDFGLKIRITPASGVVTASVR